MAVSDFFGDIGAAIKGVGQFTGDVAQSFMPRGPRYRARVQQEQARVTQADMNQQLQILQGDFSDEEKENAARIIIQAVQPKFYEQRLQQDPSAKFYQKQPDAMSHAQMKTAEKGRMYEEAGTGGETEEAKSLLGASPIVQIGRMPWEMEPLTPQQRSEAGKAKAAAAKAAAEKALQLSSSDLNTARQSVKTLVSKMSHGTWLGDMKGFKNFKRDNLVAIYEQYRNENTYADKSSKNRARLDAIFDGQMKAYNRAGYGDHGKNEFDWDPKDTHVKKLRETDIRDYFSDSGFEDLPQAATPDFPEENIPKTFEQLGITDVNDQQTFQEIQKALPDVDMKVEYEGDPEGFKRLMKLWRDKKLNKKNLYKAFSKLQEKARRALGVA